jgi:hypothetical protein
MILDLGQLGDFIQVTAQYSNAVMVAVLPYFSDVSKKLDLPTPQPITQADVAKFSVLDFRQTTASARLKNGCVFNFTFGFVETYVSPRSPTYYPPIPDKIDSVPRKRMTEKEAVQLARDSVQKLGVTLEDVFADREPTVTIYRKAATNSIPRYRIEWPGPHDSRHAADFIINPETREVERFNFSLLTNLRRPPPKIDVVPPDEEPGHDFFSAQIPPQKINPDYAWKLIPMMFKAIDDYGEKLSLPIPRPLTTNNVAKIHIFNNGGWPHAEIWTTNGWRFIYRHTMVNGYYSPKVFNTTDYHPFHLKDFEGKWNLDTNQAIQLVKDNLDRLNFPTNNIHMDFAPNIIYAAGDFKKIIPRYFFEWDYVIDPDTTQSELKSKIEAEVNADTGKLESLYYDDTAYWNSRPPIDVPISVK